MAGVVKARGEVVAVGEQLASDVDEWMAAHVAWQQACLLRDREVGRARRRVTAVTGGWGLARWEKVRDKRSFRTIEDAKLKAKAVRARPAVEAAIADLQKTTTDHEAAVQALRQELAALSQRLRAYGPLGVELTGLSSGELDRLARPTFETDC